MIAPQSTQPRKYRHALAINPYANDENRAFKGLFPPTGLEYIVASLRDLVGKVTFLDLRYEKAHRDPEVLAAFIDGEIDLVCIGIQWSSGFERICDFLNRLPPDVTTVVGGQKATEEVDYLFERCPNLDMVVRGEGEEIIQHIAAGTPLREIRGLSFRENGGVVHNENQDLPAIADLPFPDRLLRRNDYLFAKNGIRLSPRTFDTVLSTRGCPFHCKFCTFNLNPLGQKRNYTERPVESVVEELKGVRAEVVLFSDDNFFTNPRRIERLLDLIIESGIKKTFIAQTRIDISRRPALLSKAERAGFRLFLIGIESPHDRILEQLHKGITQQEIRDAFKVLTKFKFYLHGYFIYGNVGETLEEMLYIPTFAREIGVDSISFQKLRIEKYSPLKELVEETPGYYFKRIGGHVYSERYGRPEMKKIRDRIRAKFYDPPHMVRLLRKAHQIGLVDARDLAYLFLKLPSLLFSMARSGRRRRHVTRG